MTTHHDPGDEERARLTVGDVVEWTLASGDTDHGVVSRIERGRVYVTTTRTNPRGPRVTRQCEFWWDPHEVGALRLTTTNPK